MEFISDEDKLYMYVSCKHINLIEGKIDIIAFLPKGEDGLSVIWDKYCTTPEECLKKPTPTYPNGRSPKTHGIGHFVTADVRNIGLDAKHDAIPNNEAHALITGMPPAKPKDTFDKVRVKLRGIFKYWDIAPEPKENETIV